MGAKGQRRHVTDRARLAALRKTLSASAEGKELLALAKRENVPISFANDASMKTRGVFNAAGTFDIEDRTIALNRTISDETLKEVLPHELRHLWQSCTAKKDKGPGKLSGPDMLVWRRLVEGDAYAYQTRFALAPQIKDLEGLVDLLRQRGKTRAAAKEADRMAKDFGMKSFFIDTQADLGSYDKLTLRTQELELKLARIYIEEMKLLDTHPSKSPKLQKHRRECVAGLKKIFNRVSAPQPLGDNILKIARQGLGPHSPNYLGFSTAKELAAFIRRQIARKTLAQVKKRDRKIRSTIEKSQLLGKKALTLRLI